MPNYASVTIMGHLGKDCETRFTPGGDAITSFSIATSRKWKGKDGQQQEETTWWNCSMFGKRGEVIGQYLKKGDPILVHGEPSLRKDQTNDGRDGFSLDVRVADFAFVGGKGDNQGEQRPANNNRSDQSNNRRPAPVVDDFDESIPF